MEEIISGQKTIKAYHQEETMVGRFDVKNNEAVDAYYNADYYGSMVGPSVNFINNLSLALISMFGAMLYLFGGLTMGNLSSFVLYSRKFSGPINEMANIISELQSACAAAERVFRLIDEEPEPADTPGALALADVQGDVEMEHVSVRLSAGQNHPPRPELCTPSPGAWWPSWAPPARAKPPSSTCSCGSTTRITARSPWTAAHRRVTRTRDSLRRAYAMVLQDTWLFHGTIFENIAYGKEGATIEEVVRRCQGRQDPHVHPGTAHRATTRC